MRWMSLAATLSLIALPALAQPAPRTAVPDPNYNSNVGQTLNTVPEMQNDASNGRVIDKTSHRNINEQTIRSQQRHALGEADPDHG